MYSTIQVVLFILLSSLAMGEGDIRKKKMFVSGRLLHDVQTLGLFRHQVDFLELWGKIPLKTIKNKYDKMGNNPSVETLKTFLMENFENRSAVSSHLIDDWSSCLPLRQSLPRWTTRVLLDCLTRRWHDFSVKFSEDGIKYESRHASVILPQPFFVSNSHGSKWFETADGLWAMDALLVCGMTESARRILENMASLVVRFGHVPPRNRVYSLGRSSPPVFPLMLKSFLLSTGEVGFVRALLPLAERDFRHWVMTRVQAVKTPFDVLLCALDEGISPASPRPEFYRNDLNTKLHLEQKSIDTLTPSFILWDSDPPTEVVSVQMCAITEWASRVLGELSGELGDSSIQGIYERISHEMSKTIRRLLYSRKKGGWYDVDPHRGYIRTSSFWPIYSGSDSWRNGTQIPKSEDASDPVLIEVTVVSLIKTGRADQAETIVRNWLNGLRPSECDLLTISVAIRLISLFPLINLNETVSRCQPVHKLMPVPSTLLFSLSFTCCLLTKPKIT